MRRISITLLLLSLLSGFSVFADENAAADVAEKSNQLEQVHQSLIIANQDLKTLNDKLSKKITEAEKKTLTEKKTVLVEKIQKLTESFEELATGGYKIVDYSRKVEP
ncbi:MAG: hypothetical protein R3240_09140, partial [Gammaproteobacteria bacterium]|nr:hypothetical protein [Gammaproteobacteria bacterium]